MSEGFEGPTFDLSVDDFPGGGRRNKRQHLADDLHQLPTPPRIAAILLIFLDV